MLASCFPIALPLFSLLSWSLSPLSSSALRCPAQAALHAARRLYPCPGPHCKSSSSSTPALPPALSRPLASLLETSLVVTVVISFGTARGSRLSFPECLQEPRGSTNAALGGTLSRGRCLPRAPPQEYDAHGLWSLRPEYILIRPHAATLMWWLAAGPACPWARPDAFPPRLALQPSRRARPLPPLAYLSSMFQVRSGPLVDAGPVGWLSLMAWLGCNNVSPSFPQHIVMDLLLVRPPRLRSTAAALYPAQLFFICVSWLHKIRLATASRATAVPSVVTASYTLRHILQPLWSPTV